MPRSELHFSFHYTIECTLMDLNLHKISPHPHVGVKRKELWRAQNRQCRDWPTYALHWLDVLTYQIIQRALLLVSSCRRKHLYAQALLHQKRTTSHKHGFPFHTSNARMQNHPSFWVDPNPQVCLAYTFTSYIRAEVCLLVWLDDVAANQGVNQKGATTNCRASWLRCIFCLRR